MGNGNRPQQARRDRGVVLYPGGSPLVLAVLAVLAGAAGPTAIARWAKLKEGPLTGILDLPDGIPARTSSAAS
jgi:hypothetical protein